MNPLHRPRRLARIAGAVVIVIAAWLLLVPITVAFASSDLKPTPRLVSTLYSWWTTDQRATFVDYSGVDVPKFDPANVQQLPLAYVFRLDCGNTFNSGANEQSERIAGPAMCAEAEGSRRIVGLSLLALSLFGSFAAAKLPAESERSRNRYRRPLSQRLAMWRAR